MLPEEDEEARWAYYEDRGLTHPSVTSHVNSQTYFSGI
jgi:hypothetical protein